MRSGYFQLGPPHIDVYFETIPLRPSQARTKKIVNTMEEYKIVGGFGRSSSESRNDSTRMESSRRFVFMICISGVFLDETATNVV